VAVDDTATTSAGVVVDIDVMYDWYDVYAVDQGDFDPDGDNITIDGVDNGSHGTTQIIPVGPSIFPYVWNIGRSFIAYTPDPGFIGTDTFQYTISDPSGATDHATVTVTVTPPPLQSVGWVADAVSPLGTNPNPGGGLMIWPDKDTPTSNNDRSIVYLQASLTKAMAGITIYLKVIDVDDPSANTAPVDDESLGTDNRGRGDGGNPSSAYPVQSGYTDSQGKVTILFHVSMQPGDNYRIVASTNPIANGQYTAIQNDGTLAGVRDNSNGGTRIPMGMGARDVMVSDMLTVWRRLHVEVDAMGAVSGNDVSGMITAIGTPGATTVTVTTDQSLPPIEADRFIGGSLVDSVGNRFVVTGNSGTSNFTVTVNLLGSTVPAPGLFTLIDDDTIKGGQRVGYPDTSTLAGALRAAYVETFYDDVGTKNYNVPFIANIEDSTTAIDAVVESQWESEVFGAEDFWVAYLLGAFQGSMGHDGDPDGEFSNPGAHLGITSPHGGSLIFRETLADYDRLPGHPTPKEPDTVVHEIGHAVGNIYAVPGTGKDPWPLTLNSAGQPSVYDPRTLNAIRSAKKPWGNN